MEGLARAVGDPQRVTLESTATGTRAACISLNDLFDSMKRIKKW